MGMTPRERVIRTLRFEQPDRVAFDLMEGSVWPELVDYFRLRTGRRYGGGLRAERGAEDADGSTVLNSPQGGVIRLLDPDFRWASVVNVGPYPPTPTWGKPEGAHTKDLRRGPLADARTVADVEAYKQPDPAWYQPGDFEGARERWPDHALVFSASWKPLFWSACEAFGMEEALVKIVSEPHLFEAFVRRQHEFYMDVLRRGLQAARGLCDVCWLGDDFASQQSMLISPQLWRRHIRPYLAEQVALAHEHGMLVFYHSCGAVRPVLPDLIDIGVNALLVFQTTARGMEPESIARDFGGRMAFYGGIDVQRLLSFGTPEEVKEAVRRNVRAFERCGGYIVANSHHGVPTIRGENIIAMCDAARECKYPLAARPS